MPIKRIPPGPNQQSVWDYPRPPRLADCSKHLRVVVGGLTIADSRQAKRVLETSHPPVYYIPPEDIRMDALHPNSKQSWCEWKGTARYFDLHIGGQIITEVAWSYSSPRPAFAGITDHLAFYPQRFDACLVDDEQVQPQPGGFYGGWITNDIVGPFKGEPGTMGW